MSFIVLNVSHLIPEGCDRRNFSIQFPDKMLAPGRHRVMNVVPENIKKYIEKRIEHNGVKYEVLRVVEVPGGEITSPGDREAMAKKLDEELKKIDRKTLEMKIEKDRKEQEQATRIYQERYKEHEKEQRLMEIDEAKELFKISGEHKDFAPRQDGIINEELLKQVQDAPKMDKNPGDVGGDAVDGDAVTPPEDAEARKSAEDARKALENVLVPTPEVVATEPVAVVTDLAEQQAAAVEIPEEVIAEVPETEAVVEAPTVVVAIAEPTPVPAVDSQMIMHASSSELPAPIKTGGSKKKGGRGKQNKVIE